VLEFQNLVLLLLLPLALLPWLPFFRPYTFKFSSTQVLKPAWTLKKLLVALPTLLESLALMLLILALARPQMVNRETIRESQGLDILLAIDTSGSMEVPDMGDAMAPMSRLEAAKLVMIRFVENRPDDRVGLLVFGREAFVSVPLTLDHTALRELISQLEPGMAGKDATAVGSAIAVGAQRMKELKAPSKVMILVTDGRSNAGVVGPVEAAQAAAVLGIRVYTIGVGSSGGRGLMRMFGAGGADVDEPTLKQVASLTGGKFYRATDAQALAAVYQEINALERSPARVKEFVERDELYLSVLLPGFVLYGCSFFLMHSFLRRLP
jgi:Ca-activated chloride channel family protein